MNQNAGLSDDPFDAHAIAHFEIASTVTASAE